MGNNKRTRTREERANGIKKFQEKVSSRAPRGAFLDETKEDILKPGQEVYLVLDETFVPAIYVGGRGENGEGRHLFAYGFSVDGFTEGRMSGGMSVNRDEENYVVRGEIKRYSRPEVPHNYYDGNVAKIIKERMRGAGL